MRAKWGILVAGLLIVAAAFLSVGGGAQAQDQPKTVTCSFSNPAYSGWCKQNAPIPQGGSAEKVCQGILNCLNDAQCNATYCNATGLRGNWKLEKIEAK